MAEAEQRDIERRVRELFAEQLVTTLCHFRMLIPISWRLWRWYLCRPREFIRTLGTVHALAHHAHNVPLIIRQPNEWGLRYYWESYKPELEEDLMRLQSPLLEDWEMFWQQVEELLPAYGIDPASPAGDHEETEAA
jgi:hypothetical protein